MFTDEEIMQIAESVNREDEQTVARIFKLLEREYTPMGAYGHCVMLYAVAYEMGLQNGSQLVQRTGIKGGHGNVSV